MRAARYEKSGQLPNMKLIGASTANSKALDIAQHLIAYEAINRDSPETHGPAALQVCEKLRRPLSTLAGTAGFRSLLVRALFLAKREEPVLDTVRITEDGLLEGLNHNTEGPDGTLLIAELLELLMTFIGEALTLRMLSETWPALLDDDAEIVDGERL